MVGQAEPSMRKHVQIVRTSVSILLYTLVHHRLIASICTVSSCVILGTIYLSQYNQVLPTLEGNISYFDYPIPANESGNAKDTWF